MPLTLGENRGDTDETGRSRDGGTTERVLTEYNKSFPLQQKLKKHSSLNVSVSPKRVCVFTVMAELCKQKGRSNRQNPDDLSYICLSFFFMCHALRYQPQSTPISLVTNPTPPQIGGAAVERWSRQTRTRAGDLFFCYIWI